MGYQNICGCSLSCFSTDDQMGVNVYQITELSSARNESSSEVSTIHYAIIVLSCAVLFMIIAASVYRSRKSSSRIISAGRRMEEDYSSRSHGISLDNLDE